MHRRSLLQTIGVAAAKSLLPRSATMASALPGPRDPAKAAPPNLLFILADDLGWPQLGCYGSTFYQTPNIDRLAREGMTFTDAYAAAPVCSPTRASIMTGKYPARLHLTDFIAGSDFPYEKYLQPDWQKHLPLEELTIAEVLKQAGYTTASFGKWHLSIAKKPPESLPFDPDKQGFDRTIITEKPRPGQDPDKDPHNVELITQTSLEFLQNNMDKPFLLCVAHNTIHDPIMAPDSLVEKYRKRPGSDLPRNNPVLAAMIEQLDNSTARLLNKLDDLGIAAKTIVVFLSDNGGLEKNAAQTPLRSGKANLYEGGIRTPLIIRWPGVVRPATVCREPVISVDFFPTFLEMLALDSKAGLPLDGVSLVPLLTQTAPLQSRAIYWHYPHYHGSSVGPCGAVRKGNYKLIEWFDETICGPAGRFELYNLKDDPAEERNLATEMPSKAQELAKDLADWRVRVGAQMMTANPLYNPQRAKKSKKPT